MKQQGQIFLILLVMILATIGWLRRQWQDPSLPQLYVMHWGENSREPVIYGLRDSAAIERLGGCISFLDTEQERRVVCGPYRLVVRPERGVNGAVVADRLLIPDYMKADGPEAAAGKQSKEEGGETRED